MGIWFRCGLCLLLAVSAVRCGRSGETAGRRCFTLPSADVRLKPAVSGTVATVAVKPGQEVAAGAVLLTLDDRTPKFRIDRLNHEYEAAKAELESARLIAQIAAERHRIAVVNNDNSVIPIGEVFDANIEAERDKIRKLQAEKRLKLLEAEIAESRAALADYRVLAPFTGVVEEIDLHPGMAVQASDNLVRLVRIDPLHIATGAGVKAPSPEATLKVQAVGYGGDAGMREAGFLWMSTVNGPAGRMAYYELPNPGTPEQPRLQPGEVVQLLLP